VPAERKTGLLREIDAWIATGVTQGRGSMLRHGAPPALTPRAYLRADDRSVLWTTQPVGSHIMLRS
jgi:hypothetical protein